MASGHAPNAERTEIRSIAAARAAGAAAVAKLAEAERLRAEAVAGLVEFDAIDAHVVEGFATPERHLIYRGNVIGSEANRLYRIVRFCARHTLVADALDAGEITVDHAHVLQAAARSVDPDRFDDDLLDLLAAAQGVEFDVFRDRVDVWVWRVSPEQTSDEVENTFDKRSLTTQRDLFGGGRGNFNLDAAGMNSLELALETPPDPAQTTAPQRNRAQRRADRLVELAEMAAAGDHSSSEPTGTRRAGGAVDVVIDLPTLLGIPFDLQNHRDNNGDVDWDSIRQSFSGAGPAPRPVLSQFFCDSSYRQLITSGPHIVLDYNRATPDISRALRRAIQRRDRCCQFAGCDRVWQWCDVHHLAPKEEGGPTNEQNLALVCRFHHTLIHQGGWKLTRRPDGRLLTTSP